MTHGAPDHTINGRFVPELVENGKLTCALPRDAQQQNRHEGLALRLLAVLLALFPTAVRAAAPAADLVFLGGAVYTVDAARTWASAVAVAHERIVYVGDDANVRQWIGPATRVVNLHGRMLLPGFQDSHVHPADAPNPATALDLHGVLDRAQVFARIRAYATSHPEKAWIVGDGWDEAAFLRGGGPTRQMLDALVPDRPALLYDNSGHAAWVNSRALAAAHITAQTPQPANGRIEWGPDDEPNGVLAEDSAMELVQAVMPAVAPHEVLANLSAALSEMGRLGITAFEDAMATPAIARAYRTLDARGKLQQRTNLCLPFRPTDDDEAQLSAFRAQRAALAGRRLRATCVKLFLDGAASHTLALLTPYSDDPKYGTGRLFIEPARLNRLVTRLDAEGFQVHMHAQGDGAVRAGLDAFEVAHRENGPRDNRHTIAHLWLVDPEDLPRFRRLGVVANMTPLWSLGDVWETVDAPRLFGPERMHHIYPTRSLLDSGAVLVWGTDWPVTGLSPLAGLETAITHRYPGGRDPAGGEDRPLVPEERVNLAQAIAAYTSAGAYLMHDDADRGSLAVGKAADLVVLESNLFDRAPADIHSVRVDMTVVAGRVIFDRRRAGHR